jgi:carotenoid 1,2-hydratase
VVATRWHGDHTTFIHESLSLTRFVSPIVQAMLPFRMPRRAGG